MGDTHALPVMQRLQDRRGTLFTLRGSRHDARWFTSVATVRRSSESKASSLFRLPRARAHLIAAHTATAFHVSAARRHQKFNPSSAPHHRGKPQAFQVPPPWGEHGYLRVCFRLGRPDNRSGDGPWASPWPYRLSSKKSLQKLVSLDDGHHPPDASPLLATCL